MDKEFSPQKKLLKQYFKLILSGIMRLFVIPFYFIFLLEKKLIGKRKAFGMVSQGISLLPGLTGEWCRRAYLQWTTRLPLKDCCISFGTTFSDHRVKIGYGVYLGRGCDIGYADIKNDCVIGSGVHILSGSQQHGFKDIDTPIRDQPGIFSKVIIGEGTWIGNGAIIAENIGKGCIIGAGSVVIKPIPDYAIATGNPAKIIRFRKTA